MKSLQAVTTFFNRFFLINFCILCIGVPLLFSSATRSVFEVNKLLIIRLVLLVVYGVWIYRSLLFKDNGIQAAEQDCYSVFGFRFRRVGLEMALLLWMICNLVSIILSPNIYLGYIGAYDRWEGLMTIFNYVLLVYMVAKLIDNTRYRIALFCDHIHYQHIIKNGHQAFPTIISANITQINIRAQNNRDQITNHP
jgi:hypothetical protein